MRSAPTAADDVAEYVRQFEREWRVMARDPVWRFYGGVDTPERRATYVSGRLSEIRRSLTNYLHRPECLALAEALDEAINERRLPQCYPVAT